MACQFTIFIGIPIAHWDDLPQRVRDDNPLEYGYHPDDPDWGWEEAADVAGQGIGWKPGVKLTRMNEAGHPVTLNVDLRLHNDSEFGIEIPPRFGGKPPHTVFGVALNSRYSPGFLDCDYPNGNGDVLPIDLDELAGHLATIRAIPGMEKAEVVIVHKHY